MCVVVDLRDTSAKQRHADARAHAHAHTRAHAQCTAHISCAHSMRDIETKKARIPTDTLTDTNTHMNAHNARTHTHAHTQITHARKAHMKHSRHTQSI